MMYVGIKYVCNTYLKALYPGRNQHTNEIGMNIPA